MQLLVFADDFIINTNVLVLANHITLFSINGSSVFSRDYPLSTF